MCGSVFRKWREHVLMWDAQNQMLTKGNEARCLKHEHRSSRAHLASILPSVTNFSPFRHHSGLLVLNLARASSSAIWTFQNTQIPRSNELSGFLVCVMWCAEGLPPLGADFSNQTYPKWLKTQVCASLMPWKPRFRRVFPEDHQSDNRVDYSFTGCRPISATLYKRKVWTAVLSWSPCLLGLGSVPHPSADSASWRGTRWHVGDFWLSPLNKEPPRNVAWLGWARYECGLRVVLIAGQL